MASARSMPSVRGIVYKIGIAQLASEPLRTLQWIRSVSLGPETRVRRSRRKARRMFALANGQRRSRAGSCHWRVKLAPRFSVSKGASSFFSRVEGQSFFSQKGLAPGPFFFLWRGRAQIFSGKNIPKSTKFFRPAAPEWGRRPSFDLKWRRRLALGCLKLF